MCIELSMLGYNSAYMWICNILFLYILMSFCQVRWSYFSRNCRVMCRCSCSYLCMCLWFLARHLWGQAAMHGSSKHSDAYHWSKDSASSLKTFNQAHCSNFQLQDFIKIATDKMCEVKSITCKVWPCWFYANQVVNMDVTRNKAHSR